ncbi:TonB family protein [Inquilinus sp. CAU 1745]
MGDIVHAPDFGRLSWREGALWGVAGVAILCAHLSAAAWMLREPSSPPRGAAPAAIMVELAPAPVVPATERSNPVAEPIPAEDVPEEQVETVRAPAEEPVVEPEPEPLADIPAEIMEPVPEPPPPEEVVQEPEIVEPPPEEPPQEPVEEAVEEPAQPAEEQIAALPPEPAQSLPAIDPPPPQVKPAPPPPEPVAPPVTPAPVASPPPQPAPAPAPVPAPAPAAVETGTPTNDGRRMDYAAALSAWLERYKEYPRRAQSRRYEGIATLRFTVDRQGNVLSYRIDESSGHAALDRAVEEMIERAQPLPPMPEEITTAQMEVVLPVAFRLQ